MRISENDIYYCENWWHAVDKNGYIFCCITSGTPNIPEFACLDDDKNNFLNKFFIFDFDKEKKLENFDSIPDEVFKKMIIDTFIEDDNFILALKGITSFDTIVNYLNPKRRAEFDKYPYWYKKVTQPIELLHFDQLPEDIQKIMDSRRMNDVDVTKTDYFFVPPNPNY